MVADLPDPRLMPLPTNLPSETVALTGLGAPAEILIDRWGIPHIYAASARDAFFVQGYNVARDRLWQLDLWRKRGLGRLAASFGPAFAEQDRASRLLLFRGDMDAEWASYGPDARRWIEAFVAGLNARIALIEAGGAPPPVEFGQTATRPERWTAEELVRIRSHGILNNAESEATRARVIAAGGGAADPLRRKIDPERELAVPAGVDLADFPPEVLATYRLATKEMGLEGSLDGALSPPPGDEGGSNNWAIAGSRTASGRPILASDPHRTFTTPSCRYIVHLDAPGLSVMGASDPHLPGVTIGHNDRVAFGITTFMADQSDFLIYELSPSDPYAYRYGDAWEPMRVARETIAVRGEASREVELCFTRHGPVLWRDAERRRAVALRTVWTEPGTSTYLGALRYQIAGDWRAFREALSHWASAPMNFVYADVAGTIAWQPTGRLPKRVGYDGLVPAAGDGRAEWAGYARQDELPVMENPARGWVASANELNVPEGHPARALGLGFEWADPARVDRIGEVLGASDQHTIAGSAALQADVRSFVALRGVALLNELSADDQRLAAALDLLRGWDGHETIASAAAAIANVWLNKHLAPAIARRLASPDAVAAIGPGSGAAAVTFLERRSERLGADPGPTVREILTESLAAALTELTDRLGPDMAGWRWGDLHHARFVPPAAAFADPALKAKLSHRPAPMPGSAFTVNANTYRMDDFAMTVGASFRMVVDVGAWDESLVINTPGQSGDPDSPHYADLFPVWREGGYVPMLWSRETIEAATERVIRLVPA